MKFQSLSSNHSAENDRIGKGPALSDAACVPFLQWALPRLRMRWAGFRKVRRQIRKRLRRRLAELGLPGIESYRSYLQKNPEEWEVLDGLCRISISRFYRDCRVFDRLRDEFFPKQAEAVIAEHRREFRCWSIGCASGEEPYTLSILWRLCWAVVFPRLSLTIVATDSDEHLLRRAEQACYDSQTLKCLPQEWVPRAFDRCGEQSCLRPEFRADVVFCRQDVRRELPPQTFDLILCRNLVFTYFDESLQHEVHPRLTDRLHAGGLFVIGKKESLPSAGGALQPCATGLGIYRKQRPNG